jgi:hypothetical protein
MNPTFKRISLSPRSQVLGKIKFNMDRVECIICNVIEKHSTSNLFFFFMIYYKMKTLTN